MLTITESSSAQEMALGKWRFVPASQSPGLANLPARFQHLLREKVDVPAADGLTKHLGGKPSGPVLFVSFLSQAVMLFFYVQD